MAFWRAVTAPVSFSRIVLIVASIASLYITWSAIFEWIGMDIVRHLSKPEGSLAKWLVNADLFDAAYVNVSQDPRGWWFSVQLLNFTASFIVFMWAEGPHRYFFYDKDPAEQRAKRTHWFVNGYVYTTLGFIGAISVAFPLFLVQRSMVTGPYMVNWPTRPRLFLTLMMVFTVISNAITPFLSSDSMWFSYNLRALHVFLFLPIAFVSSTPGFTLKPTSVKSKSTQERGIGMAPLYAFLAGASLLSHINLTMQLFNDGASNNILGSIVLLWQAIWKNPCQVSITADLFFATVVASIFMLRESVVGPRTGRAMAVFAAICLVCLSPILSISVTFPTFMTYREGWRISLPASRKK
ncbi:hypothetical protein HDU76_006591 [Blyttiomyces sp. JEL0837]|nr:hypothetical protein HDU76_006591 [Blyttiomyces sp. JEL0837]